MLATRGGKPCLGAIKTLLNSPHVHIDCPNRKGQTALHLAASFSDFVITEMLVRGGASTSLKDKQGKMPADLVSTSLKDSQRKALIGLMKKHKLSK